MAAGKTDWSVIIAGCALAFAAISGGFSFLTGGNDKLEKRVTVIEETMTWKYITKEVAAKDIVYIERALADLKVSKTDKDIYDQKVASLERQIGLLRERLKDLDHSVNQTFNAKDALATIQSRILELERAGRSKP